MTHGIFLRTNFYDVDGKVYFGEMTFYPTSGFGEFTSHEAEIEFGKWLKIPVGGVLVTNDWIILFEGKKHKDGLTDYKVHVFNGRPRFILVCKDRYGKNGMTETFFSDHWEKMDMRRINQCAVIRSHINIIVNSYWDWVKWSIIFSLIIISVVVINSLLFDFKTIKELINIFEKRKI